jgi:peptidoglycan/xylan/chitin deacetylase (PgdA/CDA1 family)
MTDSSPSDIRPARDFRGYAGRPLYAAWPGDARIAVNLNLNFEAGGERNVLEGDATSECFLTDVGGPAYSGIRSPLAESAFEYGTRAGVWRLLRIFGEFGVKVSVLGVVRALQQNPDAVAAFIEQGHEIVSHGWRWIDYHAVDEATERAHVALALDGIAALTGSRPVGWMTGRPGPNTRRLIVEAGIGYDRDALNDDLPYWVGVAGKPHLVIPYSYETNDNRFDLNSGFATADDFARYLCDAFDLLYAEGADSPKMMSIGLHDRLIGRPARAVGLIRFLEHARRHDRVWFCTGAEIAAHWRQTHPAPATLLNESASP